MLVVDNGSADGTDEILQQLSFNTPGCGGPGTTGPFYPPRS
jgi:glycosyltransferase involved in cell wall biosynthesis